MGTVERLMEYLGTGSHRREDDLTRRIESQTAAIPSSAYLAAALAAMGVSLVMVVAGRRNVATFVGQWVPTILILGLYNKLVKQLGSDARHA